MATPLVAGSAALVRQYLRTAIKIENPSAALLKAALIHSAEYKLHRYARECPEKCSKKWADCEQGWGRINLSQIIDPPYTVKFIDQSQELSDSGKFHQYQFEIPENSQKTILRVTLVYTDYPDVQLHGELINNLHLFVYSPTKQTYVGNDFERIGKPDSNNNVEGCIIESPEPGTWKIRVFGRFIKYPQDYALVASGTIANWQQVS